MRYARRIALALTVALFCVTAASAADPPPTITLLTPPNGTNVLLDGAHNPTFTWRVDFAQPPVGGTIVAFEVSTDPRFANAHFTQAKPCDPANLACFTSYAPTGTSWLQAAAAGTPLPKSGSVTFYWRVSATWIAGQPPTTSAVGTFVATAVPDTTAPRLTVSPTTVKRGKRARVHFHMADQDTTLAVTGRIVFRGTTLATDRKTFTDVSWFTDYSYIIGIPKRFPTGRYSVCIRAADAAGNSTERCARLTIR